VGANGHWETAERLLPSGAVESRQRVHLPLAVVEASDAGARRLGTTYWQAVAEASRGSVRATWDEAGGRLRLLGGVTLLRFGAAEVEHAGELVACRHAIEGGVLALRRGGSVTLAQRSDGTGHELSVTVEEYLPRLGARTGAPRWTGLLYARGQRPFHALVSRRYFELLERGRAA
jgi:hypothetical protein